MGNGPNINVSVYLELNERSDQLLAVIGMSARETRSDWTASSGEKFETIYTAPPGWIVDFVFGDTYSSMSYTDSDTDIDIFYPASGELVDIFSVVGDATGHDAGIKTGVWIKFHPIELRIREIANCYR